MTMEGTAYPTAVAAREARRHPLATAAARTYTRATRGEQVQWNANDWHGYDAHTPNGWVRLACDYDDGAEPLKVYVFTPNWWVRYELSFNASTPASVVRAAVAGILKSEWS